MAQRGEWEIHLFFIVWALTLAHAVLRPAKKAWLEQLWLGAALLALLPVLNALTTGRVLFTSIATGDWVFAGFDLTLLALAGLHTARWRSAPRGTNPRPDRSDVRRRKPQERRHEPSGGAAALAPAFGALALATNRHQENVFGRRLALGTTRCLRLGGWSALALLVAVRAQDWALGLLSYSGHTSLAAGLVFGALIANGRSKAPR